MAAQQGGRIEDHGAARNPPRVEKRRPKPHQHPLAGTEVGRPPAAPPEHEQLLFRQHVLGNDRQSQGVSPPSPLIEQRPKINFITCPVYVRNYQFAMHSSDSNTAHRSRSQNLSKILSFGALGGEIRLSSL